MPNENDPPSKSPWDDEDRPRGRDRDRDDDRPRRRRDDDEDSDDDRPRRRRRYEDDDDDRPRRSGRAEASNGLATAGLILGILAFCTAGLTAIPGLICAGLALGKPTGRGLAVAGLMLSGLGLLVGAGSIYFVSTKVSAARVRMVD